MTAMTPAPVTLPGRYVRLEPLALDHLPDLYAAGGNDDEVWRWQGQVPRTQDQLRATLLDRLAEVERGESVAFAVIHLAGADRGRAVGWTTYLDIDPANERVEIGWTWYGRSVWRTAVNTECKLLLLGHAFDDLGMGRVALKTDHRNERSQNAIARLGARREGVLRRHKRRPDGTWRDTVYFSLLKDEWPDAKARLTARLARADGGPSAAG